MQITFTPSGETVEVGLGANSAQKGPIAGPYSGPYITTPSGYVPVQGTLTANTSYLAAIGPGGAYISFYNQLGNLVTKFKMNDAAAATTGMATIATALGAGDLILNLAATGL